MGLCESFLALPKDTFFLRQFFFGELCDLVHIMKWIDFSFFPMVEFYFKLYRQTFLLCFLKTSSCFPVTSKKEACVGNPSL